MALRTFTLPGLLVFLLGSVQAATVLPNYTTGVHTRVGNGSYQQDDDKSLTAQTASAYSSITWDNPNGGLGQPASFTSTASAVAAPNGGPLSGGVPYVLASSHSEGEFANGYAYLFYYFSVDGPSNPSVPVTLDLLFKTTVGNFYNGQVVYSDIEAKSVFGFLLQIQEKTISAMLVASFLVSTTTTAERWDRKLASETNTAPLRYPE